MARTLENNHKRPPKSQKQSQYSYAHVNVHLMFKFSRRDFFPLKREKELSVGIAPLILKQNDFQDTESSKWKNPMISLTKDNDHLWLDDHVSILGSIIPDSSLCIYIHIKFVFYVS